MAEVTRADREAAAISLGLNISGDLPARALQWLETGDDSIPLPLNARGVKGVAAAIADAREQGRDEERQLIIGGVGEQCPRCKQEVKPWKR